MGIRSLLRKVFGRSSEPVQDSAASAGTAASPSLPAQGERTPLDAAAELVAASFDNPTVPPQSAPRDHRAPVLTAPSPTSNPAPAPADPTVPEARSPHPADPEPTATAGAAEPVAAAEPEPVAEAEAVAAEAEPAAAPAEPAAAAEPEP
ncbi:hypothetical protein GPJ59_27715, partial [Streptomyces bambusae]|nr:hypothetical protein [Streptomyces bambusae]